jgi:hypothetical protein
MVFYNTTWHEKQDDRGTPKLSFSPDRKIFSAGGHNNSSTLVGP